MSAPGGDDLRREIKRLEEALVESERRYRELFEEESEGRFVATRDWQLVDCNRRLVLMLGWPDRAALAGRNLLDLTPDAPILQKLQSVALVDRRAGPAELRMERADGDLIDVACTLSAGGDPAPGLIRGQVAEITERKRLETRLQGAERMEVVGRLAGGLAHDFNNLLTVVSGNSERLLDELAPQDPMRGAIAAIHQAAARAAALTNQLLAFSRRQVFAVQPLSLQKMIPDAMVMISEIVGAHIGVQVIAANELPQINADPRQIEHVIANLSLNAREAMPSGGTLTFSVDTFDVGDNAPRDRDWLRPGKYVRLVVSDTGHGMDPVTRAYAFQPFFTTKRMGNGRGLGLATVYGIVKQSHGFVWVESEPGLGATFTLLFPAMTEAEGDVAADAAGLTKETILVVEADAAMRSFVSGSLTRRGYQVLTAATSAEAVRLFVSHPSRIHLVIADSRAVTTNGLPLASRLKAIDRRVQVLAVVERNEGDDAGGRVLPTTPVIEKPFTLQALAAKVRDVLSSGEGRG
jgi:PAS domain S-box-containing protein